MNEHINSFSFNKCIAEIYTLLNYLERHKIYTGKSTLTKKILACLFPIIPSLVNKILINIFPKEKVKLRWPTVDVSEIEENELNLPIQVNGKFVAAYKVNRNYDEKEIIDQILLIDKFKQRVKDSPIKKVIHVKNKILNIII
jgi:leucyl-tRNA synthetase